MLNTLGCVHNKCDELASKKVILGHMSTKYRQSSRREKKKYTQQKQAEDASDITSADLYWVQNQMKCSRKFESQADESRE